MPAGTRGSPQDQSTFGASQFEMKICVAYCNDTQPHHTTDLDAGFCRRKQMHQRIVGHRELPARKGPTVTVEDHHGLSRRQTHASDSDRMRPPLPSAAKLLHHLSFEECLSAVSVREQWSMAMGSKGFRGILERLPGVAASGAGKAGEATTSGHSAIRPRALPPLNTRKLIGTPEFGRARAGFNHDRCSAGFFVPLLALQTGQRSAGTGRLSDPASDAAVNLCTLQPAQQARDGDNDQFLEGGPGSRAEAAHWPLTSLPSSVGDAPRGLATGLCAPWPPHVDAFGAPAESSCHRGCDWESPGRAGLPSAPITGVATSESTAASLSCSMYGRAPGDWIPDRPSVRARCVSRRASTGRHKPDGVRRRRALIRQNSALRQGGALPGTDSIPLLKRVSQVRILPGAQEKRPARSMLLAGLRHGT